MTRPCARRRPGRRRLGGYTLTEMLVVLVIIGLISAVVVPQTLGQMNRAKARTAKLQLQNVATALEIFAADVGRYPTQAEGLAVLVAPAEGLEGWSGPYLGKELTQDPWGRPAVYEAPSEAAPRFRVGTFGADGRRGGNGPNQDLFIPND